MRCFAVLPRLASSSGSSRLARDFMLALVPLRLRRRGGAGGGAAKADTALEVDEDWIVENTPR